MTYTENYQLNQWAKSDRIQMSDFNADNQKLDAALKANADAVASKADTTALNALSAQLANCGNCRIVTGTYTGTGKYGSGNKNTLTFNKKPLLLFITGNAYNLLAIRAAVCADVSSYSNQYVSYLQWSENGVSWYHGSSADVQLNTSDKTYQYIALVEC